MSVAYGCCHECCLVDNKMLGAVLLDLWYTIEVFDLLGKQEKGNVTPFGVLEAPKRAGRGHWKQ